MNYFILIFDLLLLPICVLSISCVDENNNEVDWYLMYKIPHIRKEKDNQLLKKGLAYLYITSENYQEWIFSNYSVNDTRSLLSRTLVPLYNKTVQDNLTHILYNDEPAGKNEKSKKGHTKGIVVGDGDEGGIWIVHSVPLYPPAYNSTYVYPQTGTVYGQSVLCMSLDIENLDSIGIQLQYNSPQIYSSQIPANLYTKYLNLSKVIERIPIESPPWNHTLNITTRKGQSFISFAKNKHFEEDLYEYWVAPTLQTNLLVETWLNGPGKLSSNCSTTYSVKNIEKIKLNVPKAEFQSALDHSKWAVSNSTSSAWVCIGDINRAEHQKSRGGGTVCINNKIIANLYRSTVDGIEDCNKTKNSTLNNDLYYVYNV